jgi:hypothetical protein
VRKAIISIASEADSLPPFINRGGFSELTPADEPLSIFGPFSGENSQRKSGENDG